MRKNVILSRNTVVGRSYAVLGVGLSGEKLFRRGELGI